MAFGDINILDNATFNSDANYIDSAALDNNRVIHIYSEVTADLLTTVVGTVTNNVISYGSEVNVLNPSLDYSSICKVDTDKVFAIYRAHHTNEARAIIGLISGNVINWQTEYTLPNPDSNIYDGPIDIELQDTNKIIVTYTGYTSSTTDGVWSLICDISGNVITFGNVYTLSTGGAGYISKDHQSIAVLSSTKSLVIFRDGSNNNYGTAMILDINGTIITPNIKYVFVSSLISYANARLMSDGRVLIAYGQNDPYTLFATVSGTTITFSGLDEVKNVTSMHSMQILTYPDDIYTIIFSVYYSSYSYLFGQNVFVTGDNRDKYTLTTLLDRQYGSYLAAAKLNDTGDVILSYALLPGGGVNTAKDLLLSSDLGHTPVSIPIVPVEIDFNPNNVSVRTGQGITLNNIELGVTPNNVDIIEGIGALIDLNNIELDFIPNNVSVSAGQTLFINNIELDITPNNVNVSAGQTLSINNIELGITPNNVSVHLGVGALININNIELDFIVNSVSIVSFSWLGKSNYSNSNVKVSGLNNSESNRDDYKNSNVKVSGESNSKSLTESIKSSKISKSGEDNSSIL